MNKVLLYLFSALIIIPAFAKDDPQALKGRVFKLPAGVSSKDYLPNTLIVKFKGGPAGSTRLFSSAQGIQTLEVKSASITHINQLFKNSSSQTKSNSVSAQKSQDIGLNRIYELKFSGKAGIEQVINEILQNKNVEYAEPGYIYHTQYAPNDASFSNQSYLTQIKTPQAWDIIKNSSGIIIGIVDSGSDLDHEDLAANIYINTADPVNGTDDDNDGYIDNYKGWDFAGSSATNSIEDNDPDIKGDKNYHGIHVSGIASAVSDNNTGVASTAFNAQLLIVKCAADDDGGSIYNGYEGIKYAADHGANIINCSWGGSGGGAYGQDIIDYAISKNCLIIAAAGNSNTSAPVYPAAYKGVMAVANVDGNDVKSPFSSYGGQVDISAPGTNIYNTLNGNTYGSISGTSMASPMVASAAALVKAQFPSLTMLQVGEQLRVTADDIYLNNPNYTGMLGKGRLTVFRALTEVSSPSVRNQKLTIIDKGNGSIPAGDTVRLFFDLENFLAPANGLVLNLSSTNANAELIDNQVNIGTLNTLETKTLIGPFKVYIKPGTPDNEAINFRIDYTANGTAYKDFEQFHINASLDYRNIEVNQISTTITSNGRIGFSLADANSGLGFLYKGNDLLYEASLMIANSATKVSDNARTGSGNSNEDFIKQVRVTNISNSHAAFEARSEFDDSGNSDPLNISIKHRQLAYAASPDDKYIIAEYYVQNKNTADLSGVYIGLFTDWDIDDEGHDVTKYDATNQTGYVFAKSGNMPYAGVKLLSNLAQPAYYPLSYQVSSDPLFDNDFTKAEKYKSLSGGIKAQGLGENTLNGYDVMFVLGSGPYTIPAKGYIKVAFAFIAGDDLGDIQAGAIAAQNKYNTVASLEPVSLPVTAFGLEQNYPNPAKESTRIPFSIPAKAPVSLIIYNVLGKPVKQLINETLNEGAYQLNADISGLPAGIYFYKLKYGSMERTLKLQIAK